jgi:hypothetical protein
MGYGGSPVTGNRQKKGNDGTRSTPAQRPRDFATHPKDKGNGRPGLKSNKE